MASPALDRSGPANPPRPSPRIASWASAIPVSCKRDDTPRIYLPQAIAHRGYTASYPENTLAAFKDAVGVGAHALETDLHLSEDGVVVISHNPSLKRDYGVDRLVGDCTWDFLSTLRTVKQPAQPMARLIDLLEWLASDPKMNAIWLFLDIKVTNDANKLMAALKQTLESAPSPIPWTQRIILGCWNASFTQAVLSVLPDYALSHLSLSTAYSRHFLPIPNMGFSMTKLILVGGGTRFLEDVKRRRGPTFTWTVNREDWMEWLIRLNLPSSSNGDSSDPSCDGDAGAGANANANQGAAALLDGVVTDDPKLFLRVCSRIENEFNRPDSESAHLSSSESSVLETLRKGVNALGQLLLGSVLRTGHHVLMWYRGYYDYFSDLDGFLAQQVAPPG